MPVLIPTLCRKMRDGVMLALRTKPPPKAWGFYLAVLLLLVVSPVQAQSNGEGSIYSRFGLGTLINFSSPQSQALGGGAYALRTLNYNPDANPALWSDQVYTRFLGSVAYRTISTHGSQGNSGQLNAGTIQAIHFSFPLYERTLGVGLSFQPYSRSNYKVTQSGTVKIGPRRKSEAEYQVNFRGSGGLHKLRGGLGYRINEFLSVGGSLDFLFGILESQRRTTFERGSAGLRNVVVTDGVRLSGFTGTFGGHLALADVFAEEDAFSVGASVTLPTVLTGTRYRTLDEDLARDTLSTRSGEVELPWRTRLGIAYHPNPRWTFVADGLFAPWSTFSSSFPRGTVESEPSRFPIGGEKTLTDRWRFSMGAEVVPAGEDKLAGYFSHIAYRLGGYVEQMYVRPNPQMKLNAFAVTAGLSFPTSVSGTRIDLNTIVGTQGRTSGALVRDRFFELSLHINFGERWFQRRKLR